MRQCPKGHIYDEKQSRECPYCGNVEAGVFQPIGLGGQPDFPKTVPIAGGEGNVFPPTVPVEDGASGSAMSVTVALEETESGINPVRGWLVVTEGEKKGLSFEIHGEQNSVGRGSRFDINLSFDKAVSSEGNAVIAYDAKSSRFFLSPVLGKGKNNIYHNDARLLMPVELHDYDRIQIGAATYVFRSFCNGDFTY